MAGAGVGVGTGGDGCGRMNHQRPRTTRTTKMKKLNFLRGITDGRKFPFTRLPGGLNYSTQAKGEPTLSSIMNRTEPAPSSMRRIQSESPRSMNRWRACAFAAPRQTISCSSLGRFNWWYCRYRSASPKQSPSSHHPCAGRTEPSNWCSWLSAWRRPARLRCSAAGRLTAQGRSGPLTGPRSVTGMIRKAMFINFARRPQTGLVAILPARLRHEFDRIFSTRPASKPSKPSRLPRP